MRLCQNSLHLVVANTLRGEIFSGVLMPSRSIDEVAVCDRLRISRTPLREALKVLREAVRQVQSQQVRFAA